MQRSMLMQTDLHHLLPSRKTKLPLRGADHQVGQQMVSTSCWMMPRKGGHITSFQQICYRKEYALAVEACSYI